jgi:hypothetical protein
VLHSSTSSKEGRCFFWSHASCRWMGCTRIADFFAFSDAVCKAFRAGSHVHWVGLAMWELSRLAVDSKMSLDPESRGQLVLV